MIKKILRKKYIIIGALGVIAIALFLLKNNHTDSFTEYTVQKETVSDILLLAGTIDAKERVDLGFATSGRVNRVYFNVGDVVEKGQILAEIEQNRLESELTQARANFTLTKVNTSTDLVSAEESLDSQLKEQNTLIEGLYREYLSGDLQAYNTNINGKNVTAPIITGSYNDIIEGEYVLDVYSSNADSGYSFRLSGLDVGTYSAESSRAGALGGKGLYIQFSEGGPYGNSDWVIPVPNKRSLTYSTRKRTYESALATRDRIISDAENNLDRVNTSQNDAQVSRNQALRNQAQSQINAAASQLGDGKIRAPFAGVIAKNDLEVGEIVNAFTTEIVMFGGQEKELNLNTPEIYINKVVVGDSVEITLDAYKNIPLSGTVDFIDFIDTEVNGVPVYKTDILIDTLDERIRTGMNAKAKIIAEQKENILAIPAHYILRNDNGEQFVILRRDITKSEERIIETGFRGNDGLVEITSGLNLGDIILLEKK
jgi:RND family efflux transporter MFP subunit